MPAEIVTETSPAPECNLSKEEVERFLDELTNYMELFNPAFQRVEQLKRSQTYLRGLLGNALARMSNRWRLDWERKCAACNTL